MVDRKHCMHGGGEVALALVTWCVRCSGWRYKRVGVDSGSYLDGGSAQVYESHFLPAEETTPEDLQVLAQRLFRCAQEWGQDRWEYGASQLDFDLGPKFA